MPLSLYIFATRVSGENMRSMPQEDAGQGEISELIKYGMILAIVATVLGFLALTFKYVIALAALCVIGIVVAGYYFKQGPMVGVKNFTQVIIISGICLAIVAFVTVTPVFIVGVLVVGAGLYFYTRYKYPAVLVLLVGVGLLMLLAGSFALKTLGVTP